MDEAAFWGTSGRLILDMISLRCPLDINVETRSRHLETMSLEFRVEMRKKVTSSKSFMSVWYSKPRVWIISPCSMNGGRRGDQKLSSWRLKNVDI